MSQPFSTSASSVVGQGGKLNQPELVALLVALIGIIAIGIAYLIYKLRH